MGIEEMNVIEDSLIVIREARKIYKKWKNPSTKMHNIMLCLVKEFKTITFFPILRGQNHQADSMANKGAGLNCGVLEKDSIISEKCLDSLNSKLFLCIVSVSYCLGNLLKVIALIGWAIHMFVTS